MSDSSTTASAANSDNTLLFPASFAQQRLWFLHRLIPDSPAYNIALARVLKGSLKQSALQDAVNQLVARHETLRTRFITESDEPMQAVGETTTITIDFAALAETGQGQLRAAINELSIQPFDLEHDNLFRVHVLSSGDTHLLVMVIHHIIADAWSLDILYRELTQLYNGSVAGQPAELPELAIQYGDYADWQLEQVNGAAQQQQLDYWREQLRNAPALLDLPTDHPRPKLQSYAGDTLYIELPQQLTADLQQLARHSGSTFFVIMLAAYAALLSRYAATTDLVIGTPMSGRDREEVANVIGLFLNTLALRLELDGNPSFNELIARARKSAFEGFARPDLPFEKLVDELQPGRDMSYSPIFQTMLVVHQADAAAQADFHGMTATPVLFETHTAKFDLTLFVTESNAGTSAIMEYNTDLFARSTIERMLGHWQTLLEAVVANPDAPLASLSLLDETEHKQVVESFNASDQDFGAPVTVADLVAAQVARTPDAIAVRSGEMELSYAELDRRATRLAAALVAAGAGSGERVAICCPRDPLLAIAALACVKSGACYVPVDPAYPPERIDAMLADAAPAVIVSHSNVALPEQPATVVLLDQFDFAATTDSIDLPGPDIDDPLYCIYTSGSTGTPKGVLLSQRGLANLLQWQLGHPRLGVPARTLQFASFSFDVSFQELFSTWANGGELVMIDESLRQDLPALARFIAAEQIERLFLPFAALQPLADSWAADDSLQLALRDVVVAGEQLQVTPAVRALFTRLSNAALHNHYGPSETHVVTALTLSGGNGSDANQRSGPGAWPSLPSIGTPVANTRCYVLDAQQQPVPVGLPGELYLGGVQVALGYRNRPQLDAEKFMANPFVAGDRLYRTGDRVRWLDNGQLEFLGRVDDQVKWRGFRIEPGEIETALSAHPEVEAAVVVIRTDTGDPRLVAYVTGKDQTQTLDTAALAQALKATLPDYMQPSIIVALAALPLTPSGKVARRALPAPDYSQVQTAPYVAARTPTETALVELWQQVLKLDQVSVHDDFFQLGGHSLLATQLVARVRQTLDVEPPLMSLFAGPTIAEFATVLDELRGIAGPPPIAKTNRDVALPLSFAQQRLWFLDQLEPGNPVYNFPIVLELRGKLDSAALHASINALIARHESLRTRFATSNNQPVQIIDAAAPTALQQLDAQTMSSGEVQQQINQLVQAGFDLNVAPLLRAHLLQTADDCHTLVLVTHHIVSDGWSLGVLLNELSALYSAHVAGADAQLNALPIQYADYAVWQREWLSGAELTRQLDYWRTQLADAPDVLDIPTDWPRPAEQTFNGSGEQQQLSPQLLTSLHDLARQQNCTLYMVLLAAFDLLLARYAGTDDVVVGSPIAGRRMQETEALIGYFANTLALRNDLSGDPTFAGLLQQTRSTTLDAYSHQDLPFEKLVEELQPERNLSHAPIFQVMLVLQNNPEQNIRFGELDYAYPEFEMGIAKFDLLLEIAESSAGLRTAIQYNSDLFKAATVQRMLQHFAVLLDAIVANPEAKLSELPMLTASERDQVITDFNDSAADFGTATCVHQLVAAQTQRHPDAIALTWQGQGQGQTQSLSYRELDQRANALARHLCELGAAPGKIVAISCKRSLELPIATLAVLKSGACYTPVDPTYPAERVQAMLSDSAATIILSQSDIELPATDSQVVLLDQFDFSTVAAAPDSGVAATDPLYCIYTSGSTGQPKGVKLSHAGLANLLRWQMQHERLGHAAKTLQFASISFDVSFQEMFSTWSVGGELVMIDEGLRQDLSALAKFIAAQKIERLFLPFAAFQPIATELVAAGSAAAIQDIVVAGEQLQVSDAVRALFKMLPDAALHNQYGPSETHVVTALTLTGNSQDWPALPSIGRPVANTQCYVLDPQQKPVPVGLPGELYLGGKQLALGYLNRPEQDAEKFLRSPFELGARLYRTGDRVRWLDSGEIEFLGRVDEQFKWRGFRIEPGEIETTLSGLAAVDNCAVALREDTPGDKRLVAYVKPAAGSDVAPEDLRLQLKRVLPEFMLPSLLVYIDEFPLTPSGKVARRRLPVPDYGRDAEQPLVEPRNATETTLVELWKSVLNLTEVSVHDDFFALGGHSLLATQLIARIRDAFAIALPLKYIFRYPSPAALGETIDALKATTESDDNQDYEEISL